MFRSTNSGLRIAIKKRKSEESNISAGRSSWGEGRLSDVGRAEDPGSPGALPPAVPQVPPHTLIGAQTWQAQWGRQEVGRAGGHWRVGVRGDDLAWLLALGPLRDQVRGAVLPVNMLKLLNLGREAGKERGRWSQLSPKGLGQPVGLGVSQAWDECHLPPRLAEPNALLTTNCRARPHPHPHLSVSSAL